MSFSCILCSNPAIGYPSLIESVNYNAETDRLLAKIVVFRNRILCATCFNSISQVIGFWDKSDRIEYFNLIKDGRVQLIFDRSIYSFDSETLICILEHLINIFDGNALRQMQQKDPRVSGLLKNLFYQCLIEGKIEETEFLINNLQDSRIIVEGLVEFAAQNADDGDFSYAQKLLLRAYNYACQCTDAETQSYLLISVGYELARITLNMLSFTSVDEIIRNVLLLKSIISRLNSCVDRAVYSGKVNLYLQSYVFNLVLAEKFSQAAEIATLIFDKDLRDGVIAKIMFLQG